jgi:hypothetical protein
MGAESVKGAVSPIDKAVEFAGNIPAAIVASLVK